MPVSIAAPAIRLTPVIVDELIFPFLIAFKMELLSESFAFYVSLYAQALYDLENKGSNTRISTYKTTFDQITAMLLVRHVARIWPREGRKNPGGLLSTEDLLSIGASSIQRASSLQRASSIY